MREVHEPISTFLSGPEKTHFSVVETEAIPYEQQFPWRRAWQKAAVQFRHPDQIPRETLVVVDRDAGPLSGLLLFCVSLLPETARIGVILRHWDEIWHMERPVLPNVEIGKWDESWVTGTQKDWWVLSDAHPHEPVTKAFFSLPGRKLISAHHVYRFDYPGPVIDLRVRGEEPAAEIAVEKRGMKNGN